MKTEHVHFEEKYCTGCTQCVRVCATKAIRVKKNKAVISPTLCIGCGECIRICPEGAMSSSVSSLKACNKANLNVVVVSPVLYSQFSGFMPNDVLLGIERMGFDHAIDLSYYLEMFQYATEEYIVKNRKQWPLISPICPVVLRLIALNYPNLLDHILPLKRPASLVGGEIRKKLSNEHDVKVKDIVLSHITPCHAKVVSDSSGLLDDLDFIDRTLGINKIYPELLQKMEEIRGFELSLFPHEHFSFIPNARGPLWGMSGGEIAGMRLDNVIAVSGIWETIKYIEKIEMGLLKDIAYIEFRTCKEACLGGPLTVVDRYLAKSMVQKFIKMFGMGRRLSRDKIKRLYEQGWFFSNLKPTDLARQYKSKQKPLTIAKMKKIEKTITLIHGNDCGACGAPDCATFAEDVVRGYADLKDCLRLQLSL